MSNGHLRYLQIYFATFINHGVGDVLTQKWKLLRHGTCIFLILQDSTKLLSKVVATIYTATNSLRKYQFPFQKRAIVKNCID